VMRGQELLRSLMHRDAKCRKQSQTHLILPYCAAAYSLGPQRHPCPNELHCLYGTKVAGK
jgi:hypothetical protein